MSEIRFVVEEAPEGGFVARAIAEDIITEADDIETLRAHVRPTATRRPRKTPPRI